MKLKNISPQKYVINMDLDKLELSRNLIKKLNSDNIYFIEELWKLDRKKLKELGFNNNEINDIIIKLQLKGLDLNKRKYIT